VNGKKAHSPKTETLLYRIILAPAIPVSCSTVFGTGTTGVVAKKLHRN
jgi:DNA modification methylase